MHHVIHFTSQPATECNNYAGVNFDLPVYVYARTRLCVLVLMSVCVYRRVCVFQRVYFWIAHTYIDTISIKYIKQL